MFGWDKEAIKEKYNALTKDELEEDGYYYKEMISVCDGLILDTLKILKEDTQDIIKILKLPRNEKEILLKELSNSLNENTIDNLLNENILEYLTCYNNLPSDIKNIFYYIEKNLKYQNLNELKLKKEIITYDDLYYFSYNFFCYD